MKKKSMLFTRIIIALIIFGGISMYSNFKPAPASASDMSGFIWGVNGHGFSDEQKTYLLSNLDETVALAAGLGVSYYRVNTAPKAVIDPVTGLETGELDWTNIDAIIGACEKYGLKPYIAMYSELTPTAEALYERGKATAARYGSRVAYYQMGNEIDLKTIYRTGVSGELLTHYDPAKIDIYAAKLDSFSRGLKDGYSGVKRVLNIGWKHWGYLDWMTQKGVQWEVIGLDWYQTMKDMTMVLNKLNTYVQSEVIITECNIAAGTYTKTEQEQADYIRRQMIDAFNYGSSKLRGLFVYQMLDEGWRDVDDLQPEEAHYGLVNCDYDGNIGTKKIAYYTYKNMIAELKASTPLLNESFDTGVTGSAPTGWTVTNGASTTATVVDDPNTLNKSLKLYDNSTTTETSVQKTFTAQSQSIFAEWMFKETVAGKISKFFLKSGTTNAVELYTTSAGLVYRNAGGTDILIQAISSNTWYTVRLVANPVTDTMDIYVNDVLKVTGGQFRFATTSIDGIYFATGTSSTSNSTYIEKVMVATKPQYVYEAENATLSGAVKGSANVGYTGTGYADYVNTSGEYINWTVNVPVAGTYTLTFRYSNGTTAARPLELKINGAVNTASLSFPLTANWTTWTTVSKTVTLNAGANAVRLTSIGSSGGNIDSLTVN